MANERIESDSVGSLSIPAEAYYGVNAARAKVNFPISGQSLRPEQIQALAYVKKAAARVNARHGSISQEACDAIEKACDELLAGQWAKEFVCDPVQGGAGTSANMNANEVLANRANEILGQGLGTYKPVHPNDTVNFGQSTNDVYPTSGKLAALMLWDQARPKMEALVQAFRAKAQEFEDVVKVGRTQLEDAVPMTLGQEFDAYAEALSRALGHLDTVMDYLLVINMGGTAIGSGITATGPYIKEIVPELAQITGYSFTQAKSLFDGTSNLDVYAYVSGGLKAFAMALSKICNDLRLMSSGPRAGLGEMTLPPRQNGSSIMPGKINPVIPEVVTQVAFAVAGNDVTISMCVEGGQLELNAFEPVLFFKLFESISWLGDACDTLKVHCVDGIVANEERCTELLENSMAVITYLKPFLGYTKAAAIAKEALETRKTVREILSAPGMIPAPHTLEEILNAKAMTERPA